MRIPLCSKSFVSIVSLTAAAFVGPGLLAACSEKGAPAGEAAAPEQEGEGTPPPVAAAADDDGVPKHLKTMDHNFYAATSMIDSVAAGRLDLAKSFAELLTKLPDPGIDNKAWKEGLANVRARAAEVAAAKDLEEAALASGRALTTCAGCHQRITGPTPVPPDDSPIPDEKTRKKASPKMLMKEHQWAFERLLEGAYFPDVEGWKAGAKALDVALLVEPRDKKGHPEAVTAEQIVRGVDVKSATTDEARAAAYGKLLTTCAKCHDALGVTVRPPDAPE